MCMCVHMPVVHVHVHVPEHAYTAYISCEYGYVHAIHQYVHAIHRYVHVRCIHDYVRAHVYSHVGRDAEAVCIRGCVTRRFGDLLILELYLSSARAHPLQSVC
jgi:uncharacterized protein YunC (DUF1805 family)